MVALCKLSLLCVLAVFLLVTEVNAFSANANAAMARLAPEHELEGNEWNRVKTIISEGFEGIVNVFAHPHQNDYPSRSNSRIMHDNVYYGYDYYDKVFVVILYFFFGYVLDLKRVKSGLKKPFGPGIAAFIRWIYAPLCCYVLGLILFAGESEVQYNLFLWSIGLVGVITNAWTVILEGNFHLSIVLTMVNTILACFMRDIWRRTLGRAILSNNNPYFEYAPLVWWVTILFIPLCIGLLFQHLVGKHKQDALKILWWMSLIYIVLYVVFTLILDIDTNSFSIVFFKFLAIGLILPFSGCFIGWILAKSFKQDYEDCLAIAIESTIISPIRFTTSLPMLLHRVLQRWIK